GRQVLLAGGLGLHRWPLPLLRQAHRTATPAARLQLAGGQQRGFDRLVGGLIPAEQIPQLAVGSRTAQGSEGTQQRLLLPIARVRARDALRHLPLLGDHRLRPCARWWGLQYAQA
ncbi:MAG: hypothetical protein ACK559_39050, partial [bacterium]